MKVGISLNFWLGQRVKIKGSGLAGVIKGMEQNSEDTGVSVLVILDEPIISKSFVSEEHGEFPEMEIWRQHVPIFELEALE